MTQPQILERLSRLPSGGVITDQSRFDDGYLASLLNTARAKLIGILYNGDRATGKNRRINPQCFQKHWLKYESDLQENSNKFIVFRCPEVISLDNRSDGFRYIGTIDGSCNFRRVVSRAELAMYNQHKITNVNNGTGTSVLYDGSNQLLEFYGNTEIKEALVEGLFINPLDVPTYNVEMDEYPLNDDAIMQVEQMISTQTLLEAKAPIPDQYQNKAGS